jgi:phosphoglycolate phosphatase-like HAD superfamily hydrolase
MIVCDLDGTLVDSMGCFAGIAEDTMHRHFALNRKEALRLYRETSGLPFEFQLKKIFGDFDVRIAAAVDDYESTKKGVYDDKDFFDDVVSVLPSLVQKGYRFCVSSNNHVDNVRGKVKPMAKHFAAILGYQDGFFKGRDHFEWLEKKLQIKRENMVFVGDSLHDANMAWENGISFVARLGTFASKDFDDLGFPLQKIENFFQLGDVL